MTFIHSTHQLDTVVASLDLTRFRVGSWVPFIANCLAMPLLEMQQHQSIAKCWLKSHELYHLTNLVIFPNDQPPVMLLASPFDTAPLGRQLPDIDSICSCIQTKHHAEKKRWLVQHNASDGSNIQDIHMSAQCSNCHCVWSLRTDGMKGVLHEAAGRYGLEVLLD
jgi:hypothetical protein